MKKSEAFPTRFLSAPDLGGKPIVVTIESTSRETLKSSEGKEAEKTVLHFVGARKGLVVNMVNWDAIAEIVGDDDDNAWAGHKIELYPTRVPMGGKMVAAIRIRQPDGELPMKKAAPAAKPKQSVAEEMEDEIPF
jgi:hypothetical protein